MNALLQALAEALPMIVWAALAFLACVFMAICGLILGEENRWVVAGVFGAGALISLLVIILRWRSNARWE